MISKPLDENMDVGSIISDMKDKLQNMEVADMQIEVPEKWPELKEMPKLDFSSFD